MGKAVEALKKLKLFDIDLSFILFLSIRKSLSYVSVWEKILNFDFWKKLFVLIFTDFLHKIRGVGKYYRGATITVTGV